MSGIRLCRTEKRLIEHDPFIRPFEKRDAALVSALIRHCWESMCLGEYDPKGVRAQIDGTSPENLVKSAGDTNFYVAERAGEIVGFGGYNTERVRLIFVKPECQRQGVGSLVLDKVLADARRSGITKLECYSTAFAEPFYRKNGFAYNGAADFGIIHFTVMSIEL